MQGARLTRTPQHTMLSFSMKLFGKLVQLCENLFKAVLQFAANPQGQQLNLDNKR
jgi:hypothetical protein